MPPKKPNTPKSLEKTKLSRSQTVRSSGMTRFELTKDKFQLFLDEVNKLDSNGNPHPNKVELDKVRREYLDWYTPVDVSDLEMAYYGILFSTGSVYSGASRLTTMLEDLIDKRKPDSYLEFYKLIIMGNWLVKNNRLDALSYSKLSTALNTIPPGEYVVCKGDLTDTLDLHSSMCYMNLLLHKYDPSEYGSNLLPNDCPALAELPITQGAIMKQKEAEPPKVNSTELQSKMENTQKSKPPSNSKSTTRKNPPKPPTKEEKLLKKIAKGKERKAAEKALKKKLEAESATSAAATVEAVAKAEAEAEAAAAEAEAAAAKAKKEIEAKEAAEKQIEYMANEVARNIAEASAVASTKTTGTKTTDSKMKRYENRILKQKAKSIKKKHEKDLQDLNLLISKIAENANKNLINHLLETYGYLLSNTELIDIYLSDIYDGEDEPEDKANDIAAYEKREHYKNVIEDARGLLNKLQQSKKKAANIPVKSVVVVSKTPQPANNAPETIEEAVAVLSNSYNTYNTSDSEADMTGLERPVQRLRTPLKTKKVVQTKAERAKSKRTQEMSRSSRRSKKGPSNN